MRYVLEGSVRTAEHQLRVTGRLLDAETGVVLWSHAYDDDLRVGGFFANQDDVAQKVASVQRSCAGLRRSALWKEVVSMMRMQAHHSASARLLGSLALLLFVSMGAGPSDAQPTAPQISPPPQVQQLLKLMQDPAVRGWIDQQQKPAGTPTLAEQSPTTIEMTGSEMMAARTASMREHLASLAAAAPRLPSEFRNAADRLLAELRGRRLVGVLILVLGFVALGAGTEWLFRKVTARPQQRIVAMPMETVPERMRAIGLRLAFGLSEVVIFGLGSIGAFLAFDWPPLLRQVVLAYLVAAVVLRLAWSWVGFSWHPTAAGRRMRNASGSSRCPPTPPGSGFGAWRSSSAGSPSGGPRSMSSAPWVSRPRRASSWPIPSGLGSSPLP